MVSTGVCCNVAFRADVEGGAVERHTQPVPQATADSPGRVNGDPDQLMEPRSASPQHEVEQSRGPVFYYRLGMAKSEGPSIRNFTHQTLRVGHTEHTRTIIPRIGSTCE